MRLNQFALMAFACSTPAFADEPKISAASFLERLYGVLK